MDDEKIINFGELKNKVRENDIDELEKYVYDLYFDAANGKADMNTFVTKMYQYMSKNNISPEKFAEMQKKLLERYGIGEAQLKEEFAYYAKHPEELKGFNFSSQDIERMAFDMLGASKKEDDKKAEKSEEKEINYDNVMNFSKAKSKNSKDEDKKEEDGFSFEQLDYKKVQSSDFYNKYSENLKYDTVIRYYLKNDTNDIEIILDKDRVNLISKGPINLVDMDLNDFLVSYKNMLDLKLKVVISENCNIYEY